MHANKEREEGKRKGEKKGKRKEKKVNIDKEREDLIKFLKNDLHHSLSSLFLERSEKPTSCRRTSSFFPLHLTKNSPKTLVGVALIIMWYVPLCILCVCVCFFLNFVLGGGVGVFIHV